MNRNLAVRTYPEFDAGMPADPTHWTLEELKEWKSILDARRVGGRCSKVDARWEQMLAYRESRLEFYQYASSADLPAEVVQELPLGHVASRAFWVAPAVGLSSHEMAGLLTTMKARAPGTKREALIVAKIINTWNSKKAFRAGRDRLFRLWAVLPGGLCLTVKEKASKPTITINWNGEQINEVYATLDQLPDLRRFIRHWRTMLRNLMAASMTLALPVVPKLGESTFLALPIRGVAGTEFNAIVMSKTTPQLRPGPILKSVTMVKHHRDENWAERFALAGEFLRALDRLLPSAADPSLSTRLNSTAATLIREHFDGMPFRRVRPDFLDIKTVLGRVDHVSRQQVVAMQGQQAVSIESDADSYIVKDPAWPTKTIRFTSLALAVDFERSNRDTKAMSIFAKAA